MTRLPYLEPDLFVHSDDAEEALGASPGAQLQLAASLCPTCDRADFPRRDACPACLGPVDDIVLTDSAVLSGFTSVLHPPPGALVQTPYHIGIAAFPEGVSVLGQLLVDSLDEVSIGDAVSVVATEVDGSATYAFRPS